MKISKYIASILLLASTSWASTIDEAEAKTLAINSDFAFITAFVTDFGVNYAAYTSYMEANGMEFPNSIMNFYNQLNTFTQSSLVPSILPDIFPFTAFYSFVSAFPWYSSLLEDGGITQFYLPSDITATDSSDMASTSSESSSPSPSTSAATVMVTSTHSSSTSTFSSDTTLTTSITSSPDTSSVSEIASSSSSSDSLTTIEAVLSEDAAAKVHLYGGFSMIALSVIAFII